jgi:hypothetical protein
MKRSNICHLDENDKPTRQTKQEEETGETTTAMSNIETSAKPLL